MPEPWQPGHLIDAPDLEPLLEQTRKHAQQKYVEYAFLPIGRGELTYPLHLEQMTLRERESFFEVPL
jgi:hypothetical protein